MFAGRFICLGKFLKTTKVTDTGNFRQLGGDVRIAGSLYGTEKGRLTAFLGYVAVLYGKGLLILRRFGA